MKMAKSLKSAFPGHCITCRCSTKPTDAFVSYPSILKKPPSDVFNDIIKTFREKLMQDKATSNKSSEGWKYLMEYDDHSTRSYLAV